VAGGAAGAAWLAIVIGFEVLTMWVICEGLACNIIMLLYPAEVIAEWQAG